MSALLFGKLRHLQEQIDALSVAVESLADRVLVLESEKDSPHVDLDFDTLEVIPKRGPGRPRKTQ